MLPPPKTITEILETIKVEGEVPLSVLGAGPSPLAKPLAEVINAGLVDLNERDGEAFIVPGPFNLLTE